MASHVPFNRDQAFLLPPDLKAWLPDDNLAHFVVAAVEPVPLGAFDVALRLGGKPQHHPRLMLALLIHSHANGFFSSHRIERAIHCVARGVLEPAQNAPLARWSARPT